MREQYCGLSPCGHPEGYNADLFRRSDHFSRTTLYYSRSCIGDGAMVKNLEGDFGIYTKWRDSDITIYGVDGSAAFPNPSDEVLATFKTLDEMIEAS